MIRSLIKLMRIYYGVPLTVGLVVITTYITNGDLTKAGLDLLFACLSLFCLISGGYVLNDYCDINVDRINAPYRVLAGGCIHKQTALVFLIILFVGSGLLALMVTRAFCLVLSIVLCMTVIYDLFSKKLCFFKRILVSLMVVSLYPMAFSLTEPVASDRLNSLFIFPVWLFLTTLGYEMLKDIRDIKGDNQAGSYSHTYVHTKAFLIAAKCVIPTAALLSLAPFLLGYCKWIYLISSIAAIGLAVTASFKTPPKALKYIYGEVLVISTGSFLDILLLNNTTIVA